MGGLFSGGSLYRTPENYVDALAGWPVGKSLTVTDVIILQDLLKGRVIDARIDEVNATRHVRNAT